MQRQSRRVRTPASPERFLKPEPTSTRYNSFYLECLADFAGRARNLYGRLELVVYPDSHPPGTADLPGNDKTKEDLDKIPPDISDLYKMEAQMSAAIAWASKNLDSLASSGTTTLSDTQTGELRQWVVLSGSADAVAKDLAGYSARILELPGIPDGGCHTAQTTRYKEDNKPIPPSPDGNVCIDLYPLNDPPVSSREMVTRQVTYAIKLST